MVLPQGLTPCGQGVGVYKGQHIADFIILIKKQHYSLKIYVLEQQTLHYIFYSALSGFSMATGSNSTGIAVILVTSLPIFLNSLLEFVK